MLVPEQLKSLPKSDVRGIIEDLETLGQYDALGKVFCELPHSPYFALFWALFAISTIPMHLSGSANKTAVKRMTLRADGLPLIYGFVTIFRQYNRSLADTFLDYYCVYIRASVEAIAR